MRKTKLPFTTIQVHEPFRTTLKLLANQAELSQTDLIGRLIEAAAKGAGILPPAAEDSSRQVTLEEAEMAVAAAINATQTSVISSSSKAVSK